MGGETAVEFSTQADECQGVAPDQSQVHEHSFLPLVELDHPVQPQLLLALRAHQTVLLIYLPNFYF